MLSWGWGFDNINTIGLDLMVISLAHSYSVEFTRDQCYRKYLIYFLLKASKSEIDKRK